MSSTSPVRSIEGKAVAPCLACSQGRLAQDVSLALHEACGLIMVQMAGLLMKFRLTT